ncbi:histidine kinase [Microtetraspora sp. NBRC 13810]|uniref:sensor histidine kinase n=1 Tax=Microtetraspora sp. NBRC 13810 TaxID=3030990 RepID=UPI0025547E17|nr:histidine kinase [Microtetraspora sp. NBRC 13810]
MALNLLVVGAFAGAGAVARRALPGTGIGRLMIVVAGLRLVAWAPLPAWLAATTGGLWLAALAHLVLIYPAGRLETPGRRCLVALVYVYALVAGCLLASGRAYGAGNVAASVVLCLAVLGVQVRRWRGGRPVPPMLGAAVAATVLVAAWKPMELLGMRVPALPVVTHVALALIPVAYLAGVLRRRIGRGRMADLVVRLNDASRAETVQELLAGTLRDPGLLVGYRVWRTGADGRPAPGFVGPHGTDDGFAAPQGCAAEFVDLGGRPLPMVEGRMVTRVERGGHTIAVVVHDGARDEDPKLIEAACAAAALALDNERLTAELRARVRQLAASRARVLRAAEAERRRLERDLHDGVQQRLLSIPMALGLAESVLAADPAAGATRAGPLIGEAKQAALLSLEELRAVCQGIHPPVLTERGLPGAVRELAAVAEPPVELLLDLPGEVPAEVETTAYYVVAEALANITKHAAARAAAVTVHGDGRRLVIEVRDDGRGGADPARGSGLRGLADRAWTLGGTLHVSSPPSHGTHLRVTLPLTAEGRLPAGDPPATGGPLTTGEPFPAGVAR